MAVTDNTVQYCSILAEPGKKYSDLIDTSLASNGLSQQVFELRPRLPSSTIPYSYEGGIEMFRFGLPSTLYRFPIQHQMKTVA